MNIRSFILPLLLLSFTMIAADLPQIPADLIAKKKELLFSDDFERPDMGSWKQVVESFTIENGALKGSQTRVTTPATDGKPAIQGHQAVAGHDIPTKDSVVEVKFRLAGATSVSVEFDDRKYQGAHYGHICYVRVTPKNVSVEDQKDGSMRNDIYAMTDPAQKAEKAKLLVGRRATFPNQLDKPEDWHTLTVETVDDMMRACIDGKPVAFLKSSGIAHPTKSKIELGCGGKDGYFDDIKIWNAESGQAMSQHK